MTERVWSRHQKRIYKFATDEQGNAVVEAVAGSGKSTTMVEAIRRFLKKFPGKSTIFLAFNKPIAEDLKSKGVNGRTFHSLCFGPVTQSKKVRQVNSDKVRDIIDARFGETEARMYGPFLNKLVGLGKNAGIGCLVPDTAETWSDLADHHDLELDHEDADYATALRYASEILHTSNTVPALDFDDLLYLAVKDGISLPKFDFIIVDEYQDTNEIQVAVIRKIMKDTSRIMVVGDSSQAIYGFRGASSESMKKAITEFNATVLPLTVTYRCPTKVVEHARKWVKEIEAAPGAAEGAVTVLGSQWKVTQFKPNDLILSRVTAPLISMAYECMKARVPVRIQGRDIGTGLRALIKRMNAKGIDKLVEKVENWKGREVEKAIAKKQDAKAENIRDKADCILFLVRTLKETDRTIPALNAVIDGLFADAKNVAILSTIHKAKGLEADTVYWYDSGKNLNWMRQPWQLAQEDNLRYVATTRAKKELILIDKRTPDDDETGGEEDPVLSELTKVAIRERRV